MRNIPQGPADREPGQRLSEPQKYKSYNFGSQGAWGKECIAVRLQEEVLPLPSVLQPLFALAVFILREL